MEQKRLDIDQLRLQRERIRRVAIGVLLVAVFFILVSCQGLAPRDAAARARAAAPQFTVTAQLGPAGAAGVVKRAQPEEPAGARRLVLRRERSSSDRPRMRWFLQC